MAKLTYWVASCESDGDVYSIIGKTRREVLAQLETAYGSYADPVKKVIYYKDAFDLFDQATNEGGGRTYTGISEA